MLSSSHCHWVPIRPLDLPGLHGMGVGVQQQAQELNLQGWRASHRASDVRVGLKGRGGDGGGGDFQMEKSRDVSSLEGAACGKANCDEPEVSGWGAHKHVAQGLGDAVSGREAGTSSWRPCLLGSGVWCLSRASWVLRGSSWKDRMGFVWAGAVWWQWGESLGGNGGSGQR